MLATKTDTADPRTALFNQIEMAAFDPVELQRLRALTEDPALQQRIDFYLGEAIARDADAGLE